MQAIAKSMIRDFFSAFGAQLEQSHPGTARAAMGGLGEIPSCDQHGTPSGESVRVEQPPPDVWRLGPDSMLELRRFRELKRFGCGCIWEDRLGYVHHSRTADR
jgi:hypothetical protein